MVVWDVGKNEAPVRIRAVKLLDVAVQQDHIRVRHAPDVNLLVEAVCVLIVRLNRPIPDPRVNHVVEGFVISRVRVGLVFDMADQRHHALRGLVGGAAAGRADANRRLVLAGVVNYLEVVLRNLVDRERRLAFKQAARVHSRVPLCIIASVAKPEFPISPPVDARHRLIFHTALEAGFRLLQDLAVRGGWF